MSQALQSGTFDIEASHSFSMRNFGKHERSNAALAVLNESHKAANGLESGKESSMSNYSRIQAESINNQKSMKEINAGIMNSGKVKSKAPSTVG